MRGMPTIHSSASSIPRQASSRTSMPLYSRRSPKNSTTGRSVSGSGSLRSGSSVRCVKAPCGMTCTRSAGTPSARNRPAPCSEWTITASVRSYSRPWAARWPGRGSRGSTSWAVSTSGWVGGRRGGGGGRLARQHVVGGQHERMDRRKQVDVERLDGQPLEMDDIGAAGHAPIAQHVGHVLGELGGKARARSGRARRPAVEALVDGVAVGPRNRAVGKAAGDERDVGPGARERGGQRPVVGRRKGGGVD